MKEDTFPTRLVAPEPKSTIALVCGASRSHLWANTALISSINPAFADGDDTGGGPQYHQRSDARLEG